MTQCGVAGACEPSVRSFEQSIMTGDSKRVGMNGDRLVGWIVQPFLVLFIAANAYGWLDILVLQREQYERLIGSEAACGIAEAYCSWPAFIWRGAPLDALAVLSAAALLWRGLPRRAIVLCAIAVAICAYLAWVGIDALTSFPQQATAEMLERQEQPHDARV